MIPFPTPLTKSQRKIMRSLTVQDMHSIARFHRIVMNYMKMKKMLDLELKNFKT